LSRRAARPAARRQATAEVAAAPRTATSAQKASGHVGSFGGAAATTAAAALHARLEASTVAQLQAECYAQAAAARAHAQQVQGEGGGGASNAFLSTPMKLCGIKTLFLFLLLLLLLLLLLKLVFFVGVRAWCVLFKRSRRWKLATPSPSPPCAPRPWKTRSSSARRRRPPTKKPSPRPARPTATRAARTARYEHAVCVLPFLPLVVGMAPWLGATPPPPFSKTPFANHSTLFFVSCALRWCGTC
jgi:hypothetical protein